MSEDISIDTNESEKDDDHIIIHYSELKYFKFISFLVIMIQFFNLTIYNINNISKIITGKLLFSVESNLIFNIYLIIWYTFMMIFSLLTLMNKQYIIYLYLKIFGR